MIIETQIGDKLHKLELPDGSDNAQIEEAINHFSQANKPEQDFVDDAMQANSALYRGVGTGLANLGLGIIQSGAKNLDAPETLAAAKEMATKVRNVQNKNIDSNPIAGTMGEIAPQIGAIAPLGSSLGALALGGAGLGYTTPDVNQQDIQPGGETALGRLLSPVAQQIQGGLSSVGIKPDSGGGKAAQGGLLGLLMGGAAKGTGAAAKAGNAGAKSVVRGITKINPDAVSAQEWLGIKPTLLTSSDSSLIQRAGNNLKNLPFAGSAIENRIGGDVNALAGGVETSAAKLGKAVDSKEGGEALQQGVAKFKSAGEKTASRLYAARDALIPQETPASTSNLQKFASNNLEQSNVTPLDAAVSEPAVNNIVNATIKSTKPQIVQTGVLDVNGNPVTRTVQPVVPYKSLVNARSGIGEQAGRMDAPSGLKQAYGAMSEDMAATANTVSPEAARAAAKANNFYKALMQRQDKLKRFFTQDTDGSFKLAPEQAANATRNELALLKKSIPKADFDNYAASELRQLGRAKSGAQSAEGDVFSPTTFLTEWDKLGNKKALLFGENTPLSQELNKAAKVAERIKGLNKTTNTSNSGNNIIQAGSWALLFKAPVMALKYGGGGYLGAKLLTSPKALKVINNYAYRPVSKSPAVYNEMATKLYQAAGLDPELKREVGAYLDGIKRIPSVGKVTEQPQIPINVEPPLREAM